VWPIVRRFAERADAIVAHGAEFDQRFVPADATGGKPWICSMHDLLWPRGKPGDSLVKLALAHDLGVSHAHRAAVDVDLLARLLTRVTELGVNLETFLAGGLRPKGRFIVADQSYNPQRNEQAKAAGFRWDGAKKEWWRLMPVDDAANLPFKTRMVA
jgi:DNA polymerase-3 subunit epsilon